MPSLRESLLTLPVPSNLSEGETKSPELLSLSCFHLVLLVLPEMKRLLGKSKILAQDSSTKRKKLTDGYQSIGIQLIPQDIIMDILSRLPIYSLFQCTLVSKAWQDIIVHNPIFATMQHNRALENQNNTLLMFSKDNSPEVNLYLVEREDVGHHRLRVMDAKLTDHSCFNDCPRIVGSCHGLLCISFHHRRRVYISNPITGECKMLPSKEKKCYTFVVGIGFDSKRKEYKVVRQACKFEGPLSWKTEIHTLGTNAWRPLGDFSRFDGEYFFSHFSNALVNGSLHWCSYLNRCSYLQTDMRIASLDMSDEQLGFVPTPEITFECNIRLMAWKGCLTIAQRLWVDNSIHIWAMKEYNVKESWTRLINVTMPTWLSAEGYFLPFVDDTLMDDIQVIDHPRLRAEFYNNRPRLNLGVMAHVGSLVSLKKYCGRGKVGRMKFLPIQ